MHRFLERFLEHPDTHTDARGNESSRLTSQPRLITPDVRYIRLPVLRPSVQKLIRKCVNIYLQAFNIYAFAAGLNPPQELDVLLRAAFDPEILSDPNYAPIIRRAGDDFRKRAKGATTKPIARVPAMGIRAVGVLKKILEEELASGKGPKICRGITMADVIHARFKQDPTGRDYVIQIEIATTPTAS